MYPIAAGKTMTMLEAVVGVMWLPALVVGVICIYYLVRNLLGNIKGG